jgi:two-component system, LytTR family, response regulator AlgR
MRVMIVDDEPLARARLASLLDECADVELVGSVGDGEAALGALASAQPDVLILDINMPGMNGKELAARLAGRARPQIVFCTAYEAHAVHAFDLGAVDYLLKPVRLERLRDALQRAQQRLDARPREAVGWLHARVRGEPVRVALDDVVCLIAEEKYVVAHRSGDQLLLDDSLRQLEETYAEQLIRLHRNCLVPVRRLVGLKTMSDGRVLARLAGTDFSPEVSRRNLPGLRKLLRMG